MAHKRPPKGGDLVKTPKIKPFKNLNLIDGRYLSLRSRLDPLINQRIKERILKNQ